MSWRSSRKRVQDEILNFFQYFMATYIFQELYIFPQPTGGLYWYRFYSMSLTLLF